MTLFVIQKVLRRNLGAIMTGNETPLEQLHAAESFLRG